MKGKIRNNFDKGILSYIIFKDSEENIDIYNLHSMYSNKFFRIAHRPENPMRPPVFLFFCTIKGSKLCTWSIRCRGLGNSA
ncbi:unnamed protein product [Moneuplotes crassus]|uniref:Uncharacterized protein n=1 Tax=Euplotes crassus TaxID=5936 RepID=A0AAD1Y967_EUPCR|nr:unnamed protein product [Moneuplotes crassus]